jgi:hypothetical protein
VISLLSGAWRSPLLLKLAYLSVSNLFAMLRLLLLLMMRDRDKDIEILALLTPTVDRDLHASLQVSGIRTS